MISDIAKQAYDWTRDRSDGVNYEDIYEHVEYLSTSLFDEYEPTKVFALRFKDRLERWLNCAGNPSDQKLMLRLVPELFFIGQEPMDSLYQAAYNGPIARWLIDLLDLDLSSSTLKDQLRTAVDSTWFGELTDSMRISKFFKLNNISGKGVRANWMTLQALADPNKVAIYMADKGLKRIVILEDFVGAGQQMLPMIQFAASIPGKPPVLICPIICCPGGITSGRVTEREHKPQMRFEPVMTLPPNSCISSPATQGEPDIHEPLRTLLEHSYNNVHGRNPTQTLFGPFGAEQTGALAVMYTNCPDNVPPIVHHSSDSWHALFPRVARV